MTGDYSPQYLTGNWSGFVHIRAGNSSNTFEESCLTFMYFKDTSEGELQPVIKLTFTHLFFSLFLIYSDPLPSLTPSFNPYTFLYRFCTSILFSPSHTIAPLPHRCSLEGWAASSIYFPLGCRWFCSLPAIHIPDHKRRSRSRRAPALLRCDCHSWEYLDLCRLLPVNLKGKHTQRYTHVTHQYSSICISGSNVQETSEEHMYPDLYLIVDSC